MDITGPSGYNEQKYQNMIKSAQHESLLCHRANSWKKLQNFFEKILKNKNPNRTPKENIRHALDHVNCWIKLGYSYTKLKRLINREPKTHENKSIKREFEINQWCRLNKIRGTLPNHISLSFLIDRTVEFFKFVDSDSQDVVTTMPRTKALEKQADEPVTRQHICTVESILNKQSILIDFGLKLNRHCTEQETCNLLGELDKFLNGS